MVTQLNTQKPKQYVTLTLAELQGLRDRKPEKPVASNNPIPQADVKILKDKDGKAIGIQVNHQIAYDSAGNLICKVSDKGNLVLSTCSHASRKTAVDGFCLTGTVFLPKVK